MPLMNFTFINQKKTQIITLIKQYMKTTLIIFLISLFSILTQAYIPTVSCPSGIAQLDLYTDSLIISSANEATIRLQHDKDSTCFNYTLPTRLVIQPSVAIAINQFEALPTSDLYFSIKPLWVWTFNHIPFQVRTQWTYTQWVQLTVNFLVQTRKDIQVGYYQRDTGLVGACGNGRLQPLYLPFQNDWDVSNKKSLTVRLFLNGFQIATQVSPSTAHSPFEIRLINPSYNNSGIIVDLSVNSITQINTVFVSYLIFKTDQFGLKNVNGFIESQTSQRSYSQPIVQKGIYQFKYFIYGLTGFSFQNQNNIKIDTNIGINFLANFNFFGATFEYFGFQYVLFDWTPCITCIGYIYTFNSQCVKSCPHQTLLLNSNCFTCPTNSFPNENRCICKQGYYNISGDCTTCPIGQIFTGGQCVGCGLHAIWVGTLCQCQAGYYNISGVCQSCPSNAHWNGYNCVGCGINSYYFAGSCVCNPGFYNISGLCNKCPTNTIFNGAKCVLPCKPGEVWTGYKCISLCQRIQHSFWNGIQCLCNQGFLNISGRCIKRLEYENDDYHNQQHNDFNDDDQHQHRHPLPPPQPQPQPQPNPPPSTNAILNMTGQTLNSGVITFNYKLNIIPSSLLPPPADFLIAKIVQGKSTATISINYITGSSFTFVVVVDYHTSALLYPFELLVQLNPKYLSSYASINTQKTQVRSNVNPASFSSKTQREIA